MKRAHAMPFGAEARADGTRFRLWAPSAQSVELVLETPDGLHTHGIHRVAGGWYELVTPARPGTRYRYRIDDNLEVPDPASRFNPDDVHGASEVIDPRSFDWTDADWRGRPWSEALIYELHVGTFSPEGTFRGLEAKLDYLARLGVTALELLPIADFPGKRDWGYDGVLQFAPDAAYGRPEDLKRLVQAAHARNLMVYLDVVYNHFGPEGNYLHAYAKPFFTGRHKTDWGDAINFDGDGARVVRDFFVHNALYWLEEFHLDGLRFDAVHAILDDSTPHVMTEIADAVRRAPGAEREIHLILENGRNESHYLEYAADGRPRQHNAQWNDDFHHPLHILLTGERDGYYGDYADDPTRHLLRCFAEGFAFQGDARPSDGKTRGEPSAHLPPAAFVTFLQNHDQVGNRALGERLVALVREAPLRAATAAWLLAPQPPLLFMGEEFGAATPFLFFCDFCEDLAASVREGRRREFAGFERFRGAGHAIPDPGAGDTFERSKLDWNSLDEPKHAEWLRLYIALLALRAREIAPRLPGMSGHAASGEVVAHGALSVRWRLGDGAELELKLNLSDKPARTSHQPRGELLYCEPAAAADAYAAGEMPKESAAYYLSSRGGSGSRRGDPVTHESERLGIASSQRSSQ